MGRVASAWCLAGVGGAFTFAIMRLGGRGLSVIEGGLDVVQWGVLIVCCMLFVYGEGVCALQRKWVPRLTDRAETLREESSRLFRLFAPLYGMSLIGASRAQVLRSWTMVGTILLAVLVVRSFPEPWRGIIDLSVAAALGWGLAAIAWRVPRVLGP